MAPLPQDDLRAIAEETRPLWTTEHDTALLLTGGTGFFGTWLLESLLTINRVLGANIQATVLSRDPGRFLHKAPHLRGQPSLNFVAGDVRDFQLPTDKRYRLVIHGATEASADMIAHRPLEMYSTICDGTRHVLEMAKASGCRKFLFLSSGAVYGEQPPALPNVKETHLGAPDPLHPGSIYGEAKRMAENLCSIYAHIHGFTIVSARCFAFVGPGLPLDTHFAVGNFIRDVLAGRDIVIKGDGTPLRSYLYSADLCTWLWTLLLRGRSGQAYNVGSEETVSIRDLAATVLSVSGARTTIRIEGVPDGSPPRRYIPSTAKAQTELGLKQHTPLDMALRKTLTWQLKH